MPLVSIVIPVYNVEKYILRCITSIQQQSLTDIEIIVVNDCTPDHSMSIVGDLAKGDHRIKMINLERNQGPMIAREKGYMAATGDYITFCDGDDYLPPTAIETLYRAAVESDADVVSGNAIYIKEKGENHVWTNSMNYGFSKVDILKSLLRHELSHNLWGKLFERSLLQKNVYKTFENATNGEDACLFYQIVVNMNQMILISDTVYYYMQNIESSSQRRRSQKALESICKTNAVIVDVVNKFPELKSELTTNISTTLVSLIYRGYNRDGSLSRLFVKYELKDYLSNITIIKSHSTLDALKILFKKYFFRRYIG